MLTSFTEQLEPGRGDLTERAAGWGGCQQSGLCVNTWGLRCFSCHLIQPIKTHTLESLV